MLSILIAAVGMPKGILPGTAQLETTPETSLGYNFNQLSVV